MPSELELTSNFFFPEALIPFAPYMQNPSSFRPQGAILRAPSHTKLGFAIPLLSTETMSKVKILTILDLIKLFSTYAKKRKKFIFAKLACCK